MQQEQAFAAVCPAVPLSRAPQDRVREPSFHESAATTTLHRSRRASARAFCTARSPPAARARKQAERGKSEERTERHIRIDARAQMPGFARTRPSDPSVSPPSEELSIFAGSLSRFRGALRNCPKSTIGLHASGTAKCRQNRSLSRFVPLFACRGRGRWDGCTAQRETRLNASAIRHPVRGGASANLNRPTDRPRDFDLSFVPVTDVKPIGPSTRRWPTERGGVHAGNNRRTSSCPRAH
jgi:hypothetical protein